MAIEVLPARSRLFDHGCEAGRFRFDDLDLAVGARAGIDEKSSPLRRIPGLAQELTISFPGYLVLEQLADLGEREAGVVAKAANEQQALEIGLVVEPVVPVRPRGRLQQADLLVVADRAGREPGLGCDLVDTEERRDRLGLCKPLVRLRDTTPYCQLRFLML